MWDEGFVEDFDALLFVCNRCDNELFEEDLVIRRNNEMVFVLLADVFEVSSIL